MWPCNTSTCPTRASSSVGRVADGRRATRRRLRQYSCRGGRRRCRESRATARRNWARAADCRREQERPRLDVEDDRRDQLERRAAQRTAAESPDGEGVENDPINEHGEAGNPADAGERAEHALELRGFGVARTVADENEFGDEEDGGGDENPGGGKYFEASWDGGHAAGSDGVERHRRRRRRGRGVGEEGWSALPSANKL